jgi:hypothetical protein
MRTALKAAALVLIIAAVSYAAIALVGVQRTLDDLIDSHNQLVDDYNNLVSEYDELSARHAMTEASNLDMAAKYDEMVARYERVVELLSPPVHHGSSIYDCDDATLDAFRFYTEREYPVCIVAGNLEVEQESKYQLDHVWLLVRFEGGWVPIDWGRPACDCQHFEGYRLTLEQLLSEVQADFAS